MSNFRLQEFDPATAAGSSTSNGDAALEARIDQARAQGYEEGFLAGQGAATETYLSEQSRLTSELVEALNDAGMTNEAARMHVSATVAPLIEAVVRAIAPSLADAGMVNEIGRIVTEAIESVPAAKPRIRCSSELAAPLNRMVEEREITAEIDEAPELLPREAQIFWDQGYDHLDMETCIDRIREVISSHFSQDNGDLRDERRGYA
ncbi:hypothetical protein [Amaricoccus macauensis]|uniref:FliH/SctL family protein n=1 Tax=Amaricoccus macauensis TaxID=57001 RepID=UPI003C7B01D8